MRPLLPGISSFLFRHILFPFFFVIFAKSLIALDDMMKTLFYYCYYRIAQGYRFCGDGYYLDWGYRILFATFAFIEASIVVPISRILGIKSLTKSGFILILIPIILLYVRTFFIPKERKMRKFKQLEERYKNERHKRLKGWLVTIYAIGTLVLFILSCVIYA